MKTQSEILNELYLDWYNNFLTVGYFAEYHDLTPTQAADIIDRGREINNERKIKW